MRHEYEVLQNDCKLNATNPRQIFSEVSFFDYIDPKVRAGHCPKTRVQPVTALQKVDEVVSHDGDDKKIGHHDLAKQARQGPSPPHQRDVAKAPGPG